MSCIFVFYLLAFPLAVTSVQSVSPASAVELIQDESLDPDALYARRENVTFAQHAAAIWQSRLQKNPNDFESAWKLARATYWIGTQGQAPDRRSALEQGVAAGRAATRIQPNRPEGHMWLAADMGALAESFGLRQGLKYRGEIKNELLTVLRLDPAYAQGSADRALGRWYYKVPALFGGSNQKSEEHLRRSLTYNPNSTASLYFLAETLVALKRKSEAKEMLDRVLAAPVDPAWAAEDRDFKTRAQKLIQTLN
jgi:cytochrome c-type biogenesis protein CcmH/NrfG